MHVSKTVKQEIVTSSVLIQYWPEQSSTQSCQF